jgi:hypothetical protein
VPLDQDDVQHDHLPGGVRARLDVSRLRVEDYHDLINALQDGPSVPARVGFQVEWARGGQLATVCDETNTFEGVFRKTTADVSWSARSRDVTFVSNRVTDQVLSIVGHEDNGVFHDCETGDF